MYLKRNRNIWLLPLLLLIFIFSQIVYSSGGVEETFLGLLYPRTLSMGGASTALSNDISGLGYNPAGLSLISQKCIGITFGKHLNVNTNVLNTGIILPFKKFGSIGFSFERAGIGDLEERNEQGELISTYSDYINRTTLNYSIKPHKLLSLGVRTSIDFRTGIEDYSSTNFRTDLGGQIYPLANNYDYSPGPLRFGFLFSNISKKPSLRIGMAYHIYFSSYKYLLLTSDLGFLNKNKDLYFGLEVAPIQSFRFRGGLDKFEPTFGFGYDGGNIQFDYSFKYVDFSTTHSFGVSFEFGDDWVEIEKSKKMIERELQSALYFIQTKNYERASEKIYNILKIEPDHKQANHLMDMIKVEKLIDIANKHYDKKEYQKALEVFKTALSIDPSNKRIIGYIELVEEEIRLEEERKRRLEQIAEFRRIGDDYINIGLYEEALYQYRQALRLDPDNVEIRDTIEYLLTMVKREPEITEEVIFLYNKGSESVKNGNYIDAVDSLEYVYENAGNYYNTLELLTDAYFYLGMEAYGNGYYNDAIGYWTLIIEKDPDNSEVLGMIKRVESELEGIR